MQNRELEKAPYVSFATFKRSGDKVATPVWAGFEDGVYYIFSSGNAGKVKRLRNNGRAMLATCDARGGSVGEWFDAEAELIDGPKTVDAALRALRNKYGWQMWLADFGAKLTGKFDRRAYIGVRLK